LSDGLQLRDDGIGLESVKRFRSSLFHSTMKFGSFAPLVVLAEGFLEETDLNLKKLE
jgi:hypothetical protein